ncbi:MAG: S-layer homology domain-containing protein [Clostridia bacterium]|nr:S-layer homology domain-containing protein [Clostridia bacterium]
MRKYCALCIALLVFLGAFPTLAQDMGEAVVNGSLETVSGEGLPTGWTMPTVKLGENAEILQNAPDGKTAIRFFSENTSLHMAQTLSGLTPGEKYTASAFLKQDKGTGAAIKIEFYGQNGKAVPGEIYKSYKDAGNIWKKVTFSFTMPKAATNAVLMVRLVGGGDVSWDAISVKGNIAGGNATETVPEQKPVEKPEEKPAEVQPTEPQGLMIAPTVEIRNGTAYSTKQRKQKEFDYGETYGTAQTLKVGENGNEQHVLNGGFELLSAANLSNWGIVGGELNKTGAFLNTADVKEGGKSLHMKAASGNMHPIQGIQTIKGGEFELGAWFKRNSDVGSACISLLLYYKDAEDGFSMEYKMRPTLNFSDAPVGEWTYQTMKFTMPEDVYQVSLLVRLMGGGDMLWDDVSLVGPKKSLETEVMPEYKEPLPGAENLLYDGSFENNSFEWIAQAEEREKVWFSREKTYGGAYSISDKYARTGSHSMHLKCEGMTYPWVGQVVPVEPGVTYQLRAYVLLDEGSDPEIKLQADCYKDDVKQVSETYVKEGQRGGNWLPVDKTKVGEWQEIVYQFTAYGEADFYALLLRSGGNYCDLYIDDVEFYAIAAPQDVLTMLVPDEVFYYSDRQGLGHATLTSYIDAHPDLVGRSIKFTLQDGENIMQQEVLTLDATGTAVFYYELDSMEEKKEYTVKAVLLNPDGTDSNFFLSRFIYRYPRPTQLDESMQFMTNGGQVINYVLAQGSVEEVMYQVSEVGCTVGRAIGSGRTTLLEKLDIAEANGMMATVTLYNHEDIRDPKVEEKVRETIMLVKDHPALLGWYLWEEPMFRGGDIDLDENLRIGTKIIKDLDPVHPIGSVISEDTYYERFSTYNDWMDLDCYPAQAYSGRFAYIAKNMATAMEVSDWQKNMSIMIQAFEWFDYRPTWDEMRNMIYQSFMEGGSGFSFHTFAKEKTAGVKLEGDPATGIDVNGADWMAMKDAQWEYDFMFDHFVNGKYPMFAESRMENARWRLAVVDGTLYAIVLNMKEEEATHVDIPLVSFNDKVKVGVFTAELLTGGEPMKVEGNGTFSVDVTPAQAAVYKITPKEATDFSAVRGSRFRDLAGHAWAREAIITLDEKGIINDKSAIAFGAGDNITRGDYAMFLVRTLGLTGDTTDNFADVKPVREYARELAIGKATGILQGVGDNHFNPDAQISRQDMMTMTSRALKLSGNGDVSGFSDSSLVADYAVSHVSAMIAAGLIKGNADGTINPLGNTTRAEAAVIMDRLITK